MMSVNEGVFKVLCRNYCSDYEGSDRVIDLINITFALEMLVSDDSDLVMYALEVLSEFE